MTDLTSLALAEFQRRTMTQCGSNRTPVDEAFVEVLTTALNTACRVEPEDWPPPLLQTSEQQFRDAEGRPAD